MPFQGGRAAVLCIAVCRTSTPSGRAGGHGPRCFWARHPEPAPTAHPDFMPAAAMLRAPRLLAAGLPRQDARCLPFQNCLLCSNQSPRAASNPVAPSLKLAAGNAAAIARFQPVRRPPTPRPARPSSVQLRGIRVSQVCMLLQKVHPPLEEPAAPGVAHCQPHARSPQCKESAYRPTVSESPTTQRCRFGRVMATTSRQHMSSARHRAAVSACHDRHLLERDASLPLSRLFSPRNPTSCSALLRTRLTITASFSRPWNPSTLPSSMPANCSFSS